MKNHLFLLIFVCFYNLSFAQTKLHPDLTQEDQEKVIITIKDRYAGVDLTDQQIDKLINITVESLKYMLQLGEMSDNPPLKITKIK